MNKPRFVIKIIFAAGKKKKKSEYYNCRQNKFFLDLDRATVYSRKEEAEDTRKILSKRVIQGRIDFVLMITTTKK